MKFHFTGSLLVLLVAGMFSGCATSHIALKPVVWQQKETKIGVAVVKYPKGSAYKTGNQGLLDGVINNAMASDMEKYLNTVEPAGFDTVMDRFVELLQKRGMQAKKITDQIDLESFTDFESSSSGVFFKKDIGPLAQRYGVDELILLVVDRFGTTRPYYGFIPLGAPKGLFQVNGQMINLKTNELLWLEKMPEEKSSVAVDGDWDQPPDYPNLSKAILSAVTNAGDYLVNSFFNLKQTETASTQDSNY